MMWFNLASERSTTYRKYLRNLRWLYKFGNWVLFYGSATSAVRNRIRNTNLNWVLKLRHSWVIIWNKIIENKSKLISITILQVIGFCYSSYFYQNQIRGHFDCFLVQNGFCDQQARKPNFSVIVWRSLLSKGKLLSDSQVRNSHGTGYDLN